LFVGGHPVTFTGSVTGWIRALDTVLALDVDVIVPGHGPVSTKAEALRLRGYFERVAAEARVRYEAGIAALDACRDMSLDDYADWHLPERVAAVVAALYREFAGEEEGNAVETISLMAEFEC
jgi:glyoxylase-like metal-dependent hydrolase (beta-lactamase superfamily II)